MNHKKHRSVLIFLLLLLTGGGGMSIYGQNPQKQIPSGKDAEKDTTEVQPLIVFGAETQIVEVEDNQEVLYLNNHVRLGHGNTFLYCDTAVIKGNAMAAKGNVIIIKDDSLHMFSDSIYYDADSMDAFFVGNVALESQEEKLFTSFLQYDLKKDWAIYNDTALLMTTDYELKSKRGIYHTKEKYVNFYERVSITGKDFSLLSDSLRFYTEQKRVVFLSPTVIHKKGQRIYCESGYYDLKDKKSQLVGNIELVEGEKITKADSLFSDDKNKVVILTGNVRYKSPDEEATAKKLTLWTDKDIIELKGNAHLKNATDDIKGDAIIYDKKKQEAKIGSGVLSRKNMTISGEDLQFDKENGHGVASGEVVLQDTVAGYKIDCQKAIYIDSTQYIKAFNEDGKPVMTITQDGGDTLYLSGDTLVSQNVAIHQDTIRQFFSYAHVEMWSDNMQAVTDSLFYDGKDSIFYLTGNPVMWSDSSQYTADTIIIYMKKGTIQKLYLSKSAMIIKKDEYGLFDQIKGQDIVVFFEETKPHKMMVTGQGESIFYMKEDGQYTNVIQTKCEQMKFIFEDGELVEIRHYNQPTSTMTPIKQVDHNAIRLEGFEWKEVLRPRSSEDLYF